MRGARIPGRAHHRPCQRQDEGSAPGRGHRAVLDQFRRAHLRLAGTAVADRVVSKVAAFFGIVPEGAQLGYSTFAIGVGMVAGYLPLMILPMFMALDRIDPALHEAAADMG
ncbi:hypothetical protein GS930_10425 [Rhodococcus hoagii]|nr:hypothetical protein [Prescottella equi]